MENIIKKLIKKQKLKELKKQIEVRNPIQFSSILKKYNLESYERNAVQIGYDDKIYILLCKEFYDKKDGLDEEYVVLCLDIDWDLGSVIGEQQFHLGKHKANHSFVQPIGDNILLLNARAERFLDGNVENNCIICSKEGESISKMCLGDGIETCMVTSDGRIIIGYFDEGIFGGNGWDAPIGSSGLMIWDVQGNVIWENQDYEINSCYSMNLDGQENLWFYYYSDYHLVKTDFKQDTVYPIELKQNDVFCITEDGNSVIFTSNYNTKCMFKGIEISDDTIKNRIQLDIVYGNKKIDIIEFVCRNSKAIFFDSKENLYLKNIKSMELNDKKTRG